MNRRLSVGTLLKKVLLCETSPTDYQVHQGRTGQPFSIEGKLFGAAIISPYEQEPEITQGIARWGDPIARFKIEGVIEDEGDLLAFRYHPTVHLPTPGERTQEEFRRQGKLQELINGMNEEAKMEYVHLRAALTQGHPYLHLCGSVKNNSPRIFLASGIVVETEPNSRRTRHGFYPSEMQNRPIYR